MPVGLAWAAWLCASYFAGPDLNNLIRAVGICPTV